jgi:hypothetical protein
LTLLAAISFKLSAKEKIQAEPIRAVPNLHPLTLLAA